MTPSANTRWFENPVPASLKIVSYEEITSEAELRELVGEVMPRAAVKVRPTLHAHDREWLAASPMCFIATADAEGNCDVSPKGDPAGFVHIVDDSTIAIPDRPGNRRVDGFRNVLTNPHVGLIFLVPGRPDTLRINGRARLIRDAPFFDEMIVERHRPRMALLVEIEEIFFHCSKAFLRSALWQTETWKPDVLPSIACLVKDVVPTRESLAELETYYASQAYIDGMYQA